MTKKKREGLWADYLVHHRVILSTKPWFTQLSQLLTHYKLIGEDADVTSHVYANTVVDITIRQINAFLEEGLNPAQHLDEMVAAVQERVECVRDNPFEFSITEVEAVTSVCAFLLRELDRCVDLQVLADRGLIQSVPNGPGDGWNNERFIFSGDTEGDIILTFHGHFALPERLFEPPLPRLDYEPVPWSL